MHTSHKAPARGFTLVELMITLSVAAILMAIAVPSFRDMAIRNRLSAYANDLIAAVNVARSEAIRRGVAVAICPTNDGGDSCSGTWNDGWMVFLDPNSDGAVAATADVLKVYEGLMMDYSLGADNAFASNVTYGPDGAAANVGVFALCYQNTTVGARAVAITRLRPRIALDTNGDRIPNRDDGSNISSCATPGA